MAASNKQGKMVCEPLRSNPLGYPVPPQLDRTNHYGLDRPDTYVDIDPTARPIVCKLTCTQINYRMRVTLNDGRQMVGQMMAFDKVNTQE